MLASFVPVTAADGLTHQIPSPTYLAFEVTTFAKLALARMDPTKAGQRSRFAAVAPLYGTLLEIALDPRRRTEHHDVVSVCFLRGDGREIVDTDLADASLREHGDGSDPEAHGELLAYWQPAVEATLPGDTPALRARLARTIAQQRLAERIAEMNARTQSR